MFNSIIQTPTPHLPDSLDFYQRLGFQVIADPERSLLTDGKALIEIKPDRYARAGVKLYRPSWKAVMDELSTLTAVQPIEQGYLLSEISGTWIYLLEGPSDLSFEPAEACFSTLGNFAGLSLETIDMERSAKILTLLGFEKGMGDVEQGWVTYTNADQMTISLMKPNSCPHLFFNPSLTYFNSGKNLAVIEQIRALNIPITEEITAFNKEGIVDNIIIRDPGGYGFFIFND